MSTEFGDGQQVGALPLAGRVALVTGGSRGLGRALCVMLAESGADVAFTYRKRADEADATVAAIEATGRRGIGRQASVDSVEDNERAFAEASAELGPIDILVNNAGIVSSGRPIAQAPDEEYGRLMTVHAFGPAQLCRLVVPAMRDAGRGDIVMISSVAAVDFEPGSGPYTMAKCAQEALARVLAAEERDHGIRVNIVAPGLIDTDMGRRLVAARPDDFTDTPSTAEQVADVVRSVLCTESSTGWRYAVAAGKVTSASSALPSFQA